MLLSELASLHDIKSDFSTKDDMRDAVVHRIVTGTCDNEGVELCASVRCQGRSMQACGISRCAYWKVYWAANGKSFHASYVYSTFPILPQIPSRVLDHRYEGSVHISVTVGKQFGPSITGQISKGITTLHL